MTEKNKKTVLVVEDERPMSKAINLKLSNLGYNVITADDGQKAIDSLKDQDVDIILLDLVMPNVGGFEVLKKLGETTKDYYIMVLSNLSQEEDKQKAKDMGADEYYIKSNISISEIVEKIQNIQVNENK
jgi:DNA-binding response OmpR family regulator